MDRPLQRTGHRTATGRFPVSANGATKADLRRVIDRLRAENADLVEQLRLPAGSGPTPEGERRTKEELEPDAYPVVANVVNVAHRSYEAWREWMDATSDIEGRQKAVAHGHVMQELCDALAEAYKVIPMPDGTVINAEGQAVLRGAATQPAGDGQ